MSAEALTAFRREVLTDPDLQRELLAISEPSEFRARVVERARGLGFDIDPDDVAEALTARRRAWNDRWI